MHRKLFQLSMAIVLSMAGVAGAAPQPALAAGPPCYVDVDATGGGNTGADWTNAYTDLQSALTNASCTEIWVAEGIYKPGAAGATTDSFVISPGTTVYGGFAGNEYASSAADPEAHLTVLSGDIDSNDTNTDGVTEVYTDIVGTNSRNVVTMEGSALGLSRILNGFTITAGSAPIFMGAGLWCQANGVAEKCSPSLGNVVFSGNYAGTSGGAVMLAATDGAVASPNLNFVTFRGNHADNQGGGMMIYVDAGTSYAQLNYMTFRDNSAEAGAALAVWANAGTANPALSNVTFAGNTAVDVGGAVYVDTSDGGNSSPNIAYATFSDNQAGMGGAVFANEGGAGNTTLMTVYDVILWNDTATVAGGELYTQNGASIWLASSVIDGGCSGISGVTCSAGNLSTDPLLSPLGDHGGKTETMALLAGSSAIDADTYTCIFHDQRGVTRPLGPDCDIGAYERIPPGTDFDGDYKTDAAKYVSSAGAVYYYKSSTSTWDSQFIGTDGEYVLNSDFDGDAVTDPAKYVAAAGAIWYFGSSDASWHGVYIGNDGEFIPASDFDGDGKTDPAKYVAAAGAVWYLGSADTTWHGLYIGSLGGGQYIPGSDFDGDGKTDAAKYVAGGVYWYKSSNGMWDSQYIGSDGTYVPRSDYDGDTRTDPAKFVSPNIWYMRSGSGYAMAVFSPGSDTTFVVPDSDFDGDGITDPAKFVYTAPHGSIWYTQSSDAAENGVYMGADTYDIVN